MELIKPVRKRMTIACLLQAISAIASVIPFIAVANLAEVVLRRPPFDSEAAWGACWTAFLALFIRIASTYTAFFISHDADNDFQLLIRRKLAAHLVRVPLGWFTGRGSGDVKKAMADDVMHIHYLIAHAALELLTAFLVPLITIIYLFSISWPMALITLVPITVGIYMYVRQLRKGMKLMDTYSESMGRISGAAIEFVQGISVVKAFGQTGRAHNRFLQTADNFLSVMWEMMKGTLRTSSFAELLLAPLTALVAISAASIFSIQNGWLQPFAIIPFTLLGLGITAPLLAMFYGGTALQEASVAATKVKTLLATPVLEEAPVEKKIEHLEIEFRNVSFSYDKKNKVFEDINILLRPGTVTALVGRSGSGKSTVARLMPRFWDPDDGQILLGGVDIRHIPSQTLYRHISFVFQEVQMLSATVRENIMLAKPGASEEELIRSAKAANIHNRIMELPQGYDSIVGLTARFSAGEAQRLSIARALLADAPILVMDEATSFADPESEALLQEALSKLIAGRTLLVIAHRLSTIQYAHSVVVLEGGRILEQGTHNQLLEKQGKYARLWESHERSMQWFPAIREDGKIKIFAQ